MSKIHSYQISTEWKGNTGSGTNQYDSYSRDIEINGTNKPIIYVSSDPAFKGDPNKYNPEELFIASISTCHMLWYLHLCSSNNVIVIKYFDNPKGELIEYKDGSGKLQNIALYPLVIVEDEAMINMAEQLHEEAHKKCFIANSCSISINIFPETKIRNNRSPL